jgi:hypothetical protein
MTKAATGAVTGTAADADRFTARDAIVTSIPSSAGEADAPLTTS